MSAKPMEIKEVMKEVMIPAQAPWDRSSES